MHAMPPPTHSQATNKSVGIKEELKHEHTFNIETIVCSRPTLIIIFWCTSIVFSTCVISISIPFEPSSLPPSPSPVLPPCYNPSPLPLITSQSASMTARNTTTLSHPSGTGKVSAAALNNVDPHTLSHTTLRVITPPPLPPSLPPPPTAIHPWYWKYAARQREVNTLAAMKPSVPTHDLLRHQGIRPLCCCGSSSCGSDCLIRFLPPSLCFMF